MPRPVALSTGAVLGAATSPAASPPDEVRDVEDDSVDLVVTVGDRPVQPVYAAAWTHDACTETADAHRSAFVVPVADDAFASVLSTNRALLQA